MKYHWNKEGLVKRPKKEIITSMERMEELYLSGIKARDAIISTCESNYDDLQKKMDKETEYVYHSVNYEYIKELTEKVIVLEKYNEDLRNQLMNKGDDELKLYIAKLEANIVKRELN